jgi:F-type H+-transporting ATPase subunit b
MSDLSVTLLAAGGGQKNFLVPNGTFFVVLLIFLIVLGVITKWVVPPITKVLHEREEMVAKTQEHSREADKQSAAADADYQAAMARARREASSIRDDARTDGRKALDEMKASAAEESNAALQKASEQLKHQSEAISADLGSKMETMATTLASRIVGVDVGRKAPVKTGR